MGTSTTLVTTVIGGVPRTLVPTRGTDACTTAIQMSTAATPILKTAFLFVVSKMPTELRMKTNDTPTFVSDIELSIIPSTITKQPDGSHKVQLSLNGILTASTNDLPKDLTDDEVRELVSNGSIEVRLFNRSNL